MERTLKIVFCVTLAFVCCLPVQAQKYFIDDIYGDSVRVSEIILSADKTSETPGVTAFYLQPGDTVTVTRILKGNSYPAIRIAGKSKEYTVSHGNLVFCDNNPAGTVDRWADMEWNKNRGIQKFFASFTPYAMIALLFAAAMALLYLGLKNDALRKPALNAVPACMLVASILEIWAYHTLGNSAFWWCSPDRYGFFGALFRVIPFIAFVAFQLYSIKLYMRLISGDEDNGLSIKPMLISIGLCVPVTLAVVFVCAGLNIRSPWLEIITIVTFLSSLSIGLYLSTKRNLKELGKNAGTMFTLFGIVWAIGAVVAIVGLVTVIFKLLLQILVVCIGIFVVSMMATRRYRDSYGNVYEEDGFGNRTKIN